MITNPDPNGALVAQNPGGRPTKKINRNRKLLLESIRKGSPWQLACRSVGLSPRTLETWIHEDPTLRDDIEEVEAQATLAMADDLNGLARKDARVLLELLKLRCPEAYGPGRQPLPRPRAPLISDDLSRRLSGSDQPQALDAPAPEVTVHPLGWHSKPAGNTPLRAREAV
jgi:hypothetical protein